VSEIRKRVASLGLLLMVFTMVGALGACRSGDGEGGDAGGEASDLIRMYSKAYASAWGPEKPEDLEAYLAVREAMEPIFAKRRRGVTQWALREAGTEPLLLEGILGVAEMRKQREEALEEHALVSEDYLRLTALVYGRWLRAVREADPPEKRLVRILREMKIGLARQLKNNPPDDEKELAEVERRLASVTHQVEWIAVFGDPEKEDTLSRIDAETRKWLEEHRERIEEFDFGLFDTAPPPRADAKG